MCEVGTEFHNYQENNNLTTVNSEYFEKFHIHE